MTTAIKIPAPADVHKPLRDALHRHEQLTRECDGYIERSAEAQAKRLMLPEGMASKAQDVSEELRSLNNALPALRLAAQSVAAAALKTDPAFLGLLNAVIAERCDHFSAAIGYEALLARANPLKLQSLPLAWGAKAGEIRVLLDWVRELKRGGYSITIPPALAELLGEAAK